MLAAAEHQLGGAGAGGVVLQGDRIGHASRDLGFEIDAAPLVHLGLRGAHLACPAPQFEGRGHAEARDTGALLRAHRCLELGQPLLHEGQKRAGHGIGEGASHLPADAADEIHQHDIGAAPADLHAERIDRFRIEPHGHGRLADLAAQGFAADQQALGLQRAHDDRHRLGGQAAAPRDLGLGQAAVPAHQRHDEALVIGAHAHLVRSPAGIEDIGRRGHRRRGIFDHRVLPCRPWRKAPVPVLLSAGAPLFHRKRYSRGLRPLLTGACHIGLIIQFDLFIDSHFFWCSLDRRKPVGQQEPCPPATGWPRERGASRSILGRIT